MQVLFLNFANSREDPLPTLQEEDETIYKTLTPRALRQHFLLHRESYASLAKTAEYLVLYRDHLTVFHYSGHAGRDVLLLEDQAVGAGGIAQLLGQCPNLKLVFLNGCSTHGQVKALLENGVPAVIATSAPVQDTKATRLGIRFYQALSEGMTIEEAFTMASGEVKAMDPSLVIHRSLDLEDDSMDNLNNWGIFHQENKAEVLQEKLPSLAAVPTPQNYVPNEKLINALWEALVGYSDAVLMMEMQAKKGRPLTLARKRMAILNSFPAPVAEHLRKLMVPVEEENEGFDKVSEARLRQTVRAYQITIELLAFTMLAQLWEAKLVEEDFTVDAAQVKDIDAFLQLRRGEQETYDYVGLIRTIRKVIEQNGGVYFVEELEPLHALFFQDGPFQRACFFLEVLRVKLNKQSIMPTEVAELCARAEDSLSDLFDQLGFLARYTLAAVQDIDVLKYRHHRASSFNHKAVFLSDLLGGLEITYFEREHYTDNRSVLLMKAETEAFLNLSPFIIDANAFKPDTDLSKIFFISHHDAATDRYYYKYVNKPDYEPDFLQIPQENFEILKVQLDAFKELLHQNVPLI